VEGGNLLLKKKHIDMLKEREYNNYGWVKTVAPWVHIFSPQPLKFIIH
jgi:DNA-directed RNA polymerase II subunit RPB2